MDRATERFLFIGVLMAIVLVACFCAAAIWLDRPTDTAFADPAHEHDGIVFTAWPETDSLPTVEGNYYLTADVTISSTWNVPSGTTNLCLNGHGIRMTGSNSVVTINAGATLKLYDCDTTTEHKYSVSNAQSNGAGFATVNDSLTSGYNTFVGGYITGGKGKSYSSWKRGGAFYIEGAVEMYGGTLIGNGQYGTTHGGAFNTQGTGSFKMYGGSIQNNAAQCGGATRLQGSGSCEIYGGKIINNVVSADGGGIHVGGAIPVILQDCEISGNYAGNGPGAGIWMTTTGTVVSGKPVIENNLTSSGISNIEVGKGYLISVGELTEGAKIGIKMNSGTGTFTSGWSTYMGEADPADYFVSDAGYYVILQNDEAVISETLPHIHDKKTFTAWTSTNSLPTSAGNYCLTANVTIDSTWNVPTGTTNLCLNGFHIVRTGASGTTGSVIQVGSGAVLNLYDCGEETSYYVVQNPSVNGAGLGVVVEKSVYDEADENARGTFVGGYITGGVISGSADNAHLIGGGVNVNGGAFTMNGGTIIGNKVCINGGAVKVKGAGASFTMNGGALLANYNDCYGGAISVGDNNGSRLCTVTINGGIIARNWSGRNGGALHFDGYAHTFAITGGTIVSNYTDGNFESLGRSGGGVLMAGLILQLSGNPVIRDNAQGAGLANNVYFWNGSQWMDLSLGLGAGADVGVYTKEINTSADIKIAVGASKDDIERLHFDIPSEGTLVFCNGEKDWICIDGETYALGGAHHAHDANTIWACANPIACVSAGEETAYYCTFDAAASAWTASGDATLKLLADVTTSTTITIQGAGTKTMDLNGHGIKKTGTGRVFSVLNGATFNITDGNPQIEHKFTVSNGLATVNDNLTGSEGVDYLTFTGGYITGGNAKGGDENGWGGCLVVSLGGKRATLNISGGTIIGNHCDMSGAAIRVGGDKNDYTVFNMTGGAIMYNTAGQGGAITWEPNVIVKISGGVIDNNFVGSNEVNVYLEGGQIITVDSAFTATASIGVKLQNGQGVFTSGWATSMEDADPSDYFTSDAGYYVFSQNGEAVITDTLPHTHAWNYTADGNVITATCVGEGDCNLSEQTLTITADGKTYDGTAVVATLSFSDGWTTANGFPENIDITYSGNTNAGTYIASVTVSEKTAVAEFTITKAVLTITAEAKEKTYGENDPTFTYTQSGLVGSDTITGELSRENGENIGTYAILQGTLSAGDNYNISYVGANLVIKQKAETIEPESSDVTIDGLDAEIQEIISENPDANSISLVMTVEAKTDETAVNADSIIETAKNKSLEFFEIKIEKTIDSITTVLDTTSNVLEIAVPYEKVNKRGLTVYSYHDASVRTFVARSDRPTADTINSADGTFYADKANGYVYVYTKNFSTYAIAYTPYYRVDTAVSLGKYEGTVDVTLTGQDNDCTYTVEDVEAAAIRFADVQMGTYTMTVTWVDGATNTLTTTVSVGPKGVTFLSAPTVSEPEVAEAAEPPVQDEPADLPQKAETETAVPAQTTDDETKRREEQED